MSRPVSYTEQRLNRVILTMIIITISLDSCYDCYNYQHYAIVRQLFYCMATHDLPLNDGEVNTDFLISKLVKTTHFFPLQRTICPT